MSLILDIFKKDFWADESVKKGALAVLIIIGLFIVIICIIVVWYQVWRHINDKKLYGKMTTAAKAAYVKISVYRNHAMPVYSAYLDDYLKELYKIQNESAKIPLPRTIQQPSIV